MSASAAILRRIHSEGSSLLNVINDILDFSKLEAGKMALDVQAFWLDDVLDSVATSVVQKAAEKKLEMLFRVNPLVPQGLSGDGARFAPGLDQFGRQCGEVYGAGLRQGGCLIGCDWRVNLSICALPLKIPALAWILIKLRACLSPSVRQMAPSPVAMAGQDWVWLFRGGLSR
jgi:hypothetical protein